jgi:hypothetical protein
MVTLTPVDRRRIAGVSLVPERYVKKVYATPDRWAQKQRVDGGCEARIEAALIEIVCDPRSAKLLLVSGVENPDAETAASVLDAIELLLRASEPPRDNLKDGEAEDPVQ